MDKKRKETLEQAIDTIKLYYKESGEIPKDIIVYCGNLSAEEREYVEERILEMLGPGGYNVRAVRGRDPIHRGDCSDSKKGSYTIDFCFYLNETKKRSIAS